MSHRLWSCGLVILCIPFAAVTVDSTESGVQNSASLMAAWETYLNYPSPENALIVYQLIPDSVPSNFLPRDTSEEEENSFFDNLGIVETQVNGRDSASMLLTLRLFKLSDGAFSEWLCQIAGGLIRIDPRLFLQCLMVEPPDYSLMDGILLNLGNPFVDRFSAVEYEISLRVKALESVDDPALISIRDTCIAILNGD